RPGPGNVWTSDPDDVASGLPSPNVHVIWPGALNGSKAVRAAAERLVAASRRNVVDEVDERTAKNCTPGAWYADASRIIGPVCTGEPPKPSVRATVVAAAMVSSARAGLTL